MPAKYDLTLSPSNDSDVPDGDGYYLHESLLNASNARPDSLRVSMLMDGPFHAGDARHTKRVVSDATYTLRVSVIDDSDIDALDALVSPFIHDGESLDVDGTKFNVSEFDRTSASLTDLAAQARQFVNPEVEVEYKTPTCIVHPRSTITEMFPHRRSVFPQLASVWNEVNADDSLKFALDPFDVGAQVFEKPESQSYRTYSTLTDIREMQSGETQPFFRQGYIGTCAYAFRNADATLQHQVVSLALFAEYAGVGADTHHGCGCVDIDIDDRGDA